MNITDFSYWRVTGYSLAINWLVTGYSLASQAATEEGPSEEHAPLFIAVAAAV